MFEFQKKRIVHLASYISNDHFEKNYIVATKVSNDLDQKISLSGLNTPVIEGESILPKVIGPVSRFNSEGRYILLKHLPKEKYYQHREFTRQQWAGRGQTEEVTSYVWIERERYQRELIPPPGIEFNVLSIEDALYITASPLRFTADSSELLKHSINLFLEYFGSCIVFEDGTKPVSTPEKITLNWQLLPQGRYPWLRIKEYLEGSLARQSKTSALAALDRFQKIHSLNPDFEARGSGGYNGYVAFGFTQQRRFVLESQFTNNAIYIFGDDWEELSKLSKGEILSGNKHLVRIIHTPTWFEELQRHIRRELDEDRED